jgi:hypothetical protein
MPLGINYGRLQVAKVGKRGLARLLLYTKSAVRQNNPHLKELKNEIDENG